jgi:pilus assembly protein CpaC
MPSNHSYLSVLLTVSLLACAALGSETAPDEHLSVTVGKSIVIESPLSIQRVAVASGVMAEVVAVSSKQIIVNGLAPGETTLILWEKGGARTVYALSVEPAAHPPLDKVREELARELPDQDVSIDLENGTVFLRGTVKDLIAAQRATAIAGSLGKVIDLLYVDVPPAEPQILLKVRFADVDRSASKQLGANIISTGAGNTIGAVSTGGFPAPAVAVTGGQTTFTLSDALNLFLFRKDLNLGVTIAALQSQSLLQILAEPNVMTTNGKSASFVAGGEFPFPTVQGGANAGAVTISFREFGIRINFLPTVTPRGTIELHVTPEVSSLDFANGLVFQGYTIPALSTRRVDTNVELESGQSFAIAGLLDNQTTKTLSKIPGISEIPILGKLFQSVSTTKSNTELLIIVTAELVRPVPASQAVPNIQMPDKFLQDAPTTAPRTPGADVTGPITPLPQTGTLPVERLEQIKAMEAAEASLSSSQTRSTTGAQGTAQGTTR